MSLEKLSANSIISRIKQSGGNVSSQSPRIAIPFVFTDKNPGGFLRQEGGNSVYGYIFKTIVGETEESESCFTTDDKNPVLLINPVVPDDKNPENQKIIDPKTYHTLLKEITAIFQDFNRKSSSSPNAIGIDYDGLVFIQNFLRMRFNITDLYNSNQQYVNDKLVKDEINQFAYRRNGEQHKAIIVNGAFELTDGEQERQTFSHGALLLLTQENKIRGIELETAKITYSNVECIPVFELNEFTSKKARYDEEYDGSPTVLLSASSQGLSPRRFLAS